MGSLRKNRDIKNAGIGFLAGLAVAIGGGVKDAPHEGFDTIKFFRSPMVGAIVGFAVGTRLPRINPVVLFFLSIGGERLITEAFKLGRAQMPAKFQFGEWDKQMCCKCPGFEGQKPNR